MANKLKICLDAGHYGLFNNSPANKDYWESVRMWDLHLMLASKLESFGVEVIKTRTSLEKDLGFRDRGRKSVGCDLFLSLHSNAVGNSINDTVDYPVSYVAVNGTADEIGDNLAIAVGIALETNQVARIEKKLSSKGYGDYYGVLAGATEVGTPALILENSFHTNTLMTNKLLEDSVLDNLASKICECIIDYYGIQINPWVKDDIGWKYYLDSDTFITNDWFEFENEWYWFDGSGHAISNDWYYYKDNWYYFDEESQMIKDTWLIINGNLYRFNADGTMYNGYLNVETDQDGVIQII